MSRLTDPKYLKEILSRHGIVLTKARGQNFLTNPSVCPQMADMCGATENDGVIEIGPGVGVITAEAAQQAKQVIAIEIDKTLIPILDKTLGEFDNVKVVNEDVLKLDINALIEEEGAKGVKIMGNLPYYITTPIIMKILEEEVKADSITIMMQKEVADRIKALPGSKIYGALSVAVQYYCTVEKVADVPRSVFVPQPNVDSVVLRLNIRDEKPVEVRDRKLFFDCVKAGFGQRRKTLLNSLQGVKGVDKSIVIESLKAAGIEASRRAETLTIEEFGKISNEVYKRL